MLLQGKAKTIVVVVTTEAKCCILNKLRVLGSGHLSVTLFSHYVSLVCWTLTILQIQSKY